MIGSLLDTAIHYAQHLGWSVHPVNIKKQPITPHGRNDATRDESTIRKLFRGGAQIGVATGAESGLFVLDIDLDEQRGINGYETLEYLETTYGSLPKTPRQRTGRGGMQYLFKYVDGLKNSSGKIGAGIDTRGSGGYIVVAPSRNANGAYEWIDSPETTPLADVPQWLIGLLKEAEAAPTTPSASPSADARTYCLKMLGQAVARVATAPDGQKHDMLLKMARWMGGFVPTLSATEIESALFAAVELRADDHRNARQTIRDGIAYGEAAPLTVPPRSPTQKIDPTTGEIIDQRDAPPAKPVGRVDYVVNFRQYGISAADLQNLEFAPLKWIADGVLPEGATLLAGKPKSKKSWLALAVAVAVAMRGKALGYYDVTPGTVLYLDLESNQRRMKSRLGALLGAVRWPEHLHIYTKWERGEAGIALLDAWMEAHPDTSLIVIDILQNFRPPKDPKADPYQQDYEAVKMINEFAERHRIAVIIIHHTRKAKADDVFDEISGTTGLSGGVASMWVLGRSPDNTDESILAIRGRDISDDEPMALRWDAYTCQFVRVATGAEASSGAERRAILDSMAIDLEYQLKDIAAAIGKTVSATSNLMRRLMDDNLIHRIGNGRYAKVPPKIPYLRESRESGVSRESSESGESVETGDFHDFHSLSQGGCESAMPQQNAPEGSSNGHFHDFHSDLGGYAVVRSEGGTWQVIDNASESVISEHKTEDEATAACWQLWQELGDE